MNKLSEFASEKLKNITILYVEDNEGIRNSLTTYLHRRFNTIHTASNGEEGLEKFSELNPDIVITDILMPVMSGLDMSRKIKELNPETRIIITTAYSEAAYIMEAMDIGVNRFIAKPIVNEQLFQAISDLAGALIHDRERGELQEQLRQAQKMETVGQLAGGIAHDFNNILTAITGYGSLLQGKLPKEDPLRKYADHIVSASEKAASLIRSLMAFSRKQIINPQPVDVNEIIRYMERFVSNLVGEDIEFKTYLQEGPLIIMADRGQLEQVLMNLITNARDAMPCGGSIIMETKTIDITKEYSMTHLFEKTGRYVCIMVSDTGQGMDEQTRKSIFEPFFTTKEVGKGTGLGLSMVYGIIKQHDGFINVYSEPSKGTTFKIYLPAVEKESVETEKPKQPLLHGGNESILIIEDDRDVLNFLKEVLNEHGYRTLTATDGEEGVKVFADNQDDIHLMLIDVVLPKKNGRESLNEIKKIRPNIKAIFMSGYTANIIHKRGILEPGIDFIMKPVMPDDLLIKVQEVLNRQ
jgi:signal transduction histidine kinase